VSSCITARLGISRSCEQKFDYVPPPFSTSLFLLIKFEFLKSTKFYKIILKLMVYDSSAVTNQAFRWHATIYIWCSYTHLCSTVSHSRVEAGSNTSKVALRVVEGDKKRSLKFETVKYGSESHETGTRE
jgi:hypothetical protein